LDNLLFDPFDGPYQAAPFIEIKTEHFLPAIKHSIAVAKEELQSLLDNPADPSFENTLEPLDQIGSLLQRNTMILYNLNAAETSPELQKVTQEAAPLLTDFQNTLRLDTQLFERVQKVYENEDRNRLTEEQKTLLKKQYQSFTRNGALLSDADKKKLRAIDTQLVQLTLTFGEHVLADTQGYTLHLTQEDDLKGLPDGVIAAAAVMAKNKDLDGWAFSLDYPSYIPFMTYAENRDLRKEMSLAFGRRGFQNNENNNEAIIISIVKLRQERAELLGYQSHAAYVLEERMAKSESEVYDFLDHLNKKARPAADKEWEQIQHFGREKLGLEIIEKWDTSFITEKIKREKLELDEQELKPYFALDSVLDGLFEIVNELYGLHFKASTTISGYHPDVKVFEVFDQHGVFTSLLYMDFFPRPGKRNGAWMTSYRSQKKGQRPHVSVVCNFTPPTDTLPSLLIFNEVTTLFHEFGHALHGMLANTTYSTLSGTSVPWDFVELPSQLMENWCYKEEALLRFAKHYQSGAPLPKKYINKLKKIAQFQQGIHTLRQLSYCYLDLSYHGSNATKIKDIKSHESAILAPFLWTKDHNENAMSTAFSHIFQGGYAAGYYSYKWAEVLDADAFEYFEQKGIFNPEVAQDFAKHILSKGGTEHPMVLYKRFRGKEPTVEALLRRSGLIES